MTPFIATQSNAMATMMRTRNAAAAPRFRATVPSGGGNAVVLSNDEASIAGGISDGLLVGQL